MNYASKYTIPQIYLYYMQTRLYWTLLKMGTLNEKIDGNFSSIIYTL